MYVVSITSGRVDGATEMLNAFFASPFVGRGFGAADQIVEFKPTNLFYPHFFEVGLLGGIGALIVVLFPIILCFRIRRLQGEAV